MSLIDIKNYMITTKFSSLTNLCHIFNSEPDKVRCLLSHWIKKGKIRECHMNACKKPCASRCPAVSNEHYEWVEFSTQ